MLHFLLKNFIVLCVLLSYRMQTGSVAAMYVCVWFNYLLTYLLATLCSHLWPYRVIELLWFCTNISKN